MVRIFQLFFYFSCLLQCSFRLGGGSGDCGRTCVIAGSFFGRRREQFDSNRLSSIDCPVCLCEREKNPSPKSDAAEALNGFLNFDVTSSALILHSHLDLNFNSALYCIGYSANALAGSVHERACRLRVQPFLREEFLKFDNLNFYFYSQPCTRVLKRRSVLPRKLFRPNN